jgi:hypothetical protein
MKKDRSKLGRPLRELDETLRLQAAPADLEGVCKAILRVLFGPTTAATPGALRDFGSPHAFPEENVIRDIP